MKIKRITIYFTIFIGCLLSFLSNLSGFAKEEHDNFIILTGENDVLGWTKYGQDPNTSTDGFMTHGTSLKLYLKNSYMFEIFQQIYTPETKDFPKPLPGDRSYAGWLGINVNKFFIEENHVDTFCLGLGTIGPNAFADDVQTSFHKWINCSPPVGWDSQLNNEPTFQFGYNRTYSHYAYDWLEYRPGTGINLGNALIDVEIDNTIRFGYNLPQKTPLLINSHFSQIDIPTKQPRSKFSIFGFISCKVKAVVRDIFLDGNTFNRDGNITVDKENFVADGILGIGLCFYNININFNHIERTREFQTQTRDERFDGLSIGCYF